MEATPLFAHLFACLDLDRAHVPLGTWLGLFTYNVEASLTPDTSFHQQLHSSPRLVRYLFYTDFFQPTFGSS